MTLGLIGQKCGMTRLFVDSGASCPVTVVKVCPNRIVQRKTDGNDGYEAIQVTTGIKKASKVTKPLIGHFAKAGVEAGNGLWEFRIDDMSQTNQESIEVGKELKADLFEDGQQVDVTGISKGKGFAGVVKRYNFAMQDATHGNSLSHRAPGSIGQNQSPGRVFRGKKMAGQMGNKRNTVQNLEVIRVDVERNIILLKGAIPGAKGGYVVIKPSVKKKKESNNAT